MAVVFTHTSSAPLRLLRWWSRRAKSSLPVPVAPVISTGSLESANASHIWIRSRMRADTCTMVVDGTLTRPTALLGALVAALCSSARWLEMTLSNRRASTVQCSTPERRKVSMAARVCRQPSSRADSRSSPRALSRRARPTRAATNRAFASSKRAPTPSSRSVACAAWRRADSRSPRENTVSARATRIWPSSHRSPWLRARPRARFSRTMPSFSRPMRARHRP